MRLVVDTNVFVSAALKETSWPGAVIRWIDTFGGLLKSSATEAQVIEVLQRPYFASKLSPFYLEIVRRMLVNAELVMLSNESPHAATPPTTGFWNWQSTAMRM